MNFCSTIKKVKTPSCVLAFSRVSCKRADIGPGLGVWIWQSWRQTSRTLIGANLAGPSAELSQMSPKSPIRFGEIVKKRCGSMGFSTTIEAAFSLTSAKAQTAKMQRWNEPSQPLQKCHFSGSSRASRRPKLHIQRFAPVTPPVNSAYFAFNQSQLALWRMHIGVRSPL